MQSLAKKIFVVSLALLLVAQTPLWGRGRGGGGMGGGRVGGGGFSRPSGGMRPAASRPSPGRSPSFSSPSISRPSVNRPSVSRPSGGTRPNYSRPSGGTRPGSIQMPSTRPGVSTRPSIGTRPEIGTRPNIGNRPTTLPGDLSRPNLGNRPTTQPGDLTRPNLGNRPTTLPGDLTRPNLGNRPTTLPGDLTRPNLGNRPTTLPGLETRPGTGDRPGLGNRPDIGNRPPRDEIRDRVNDRVGRHDDLQDRLNNALVRPETLPAIVPNRPIRPGWPGYRPGGGYWPGYWHGYWHGWHHGYWHGHWNAGWGCYWNRFPVATALGLSYWTVNSLNYMFGYCDYYNPYYVAGTTTYISQSQPLIYVSSTVEEPAEVLPDPTEESLKILDDARDAFKANDLEQALSLTDQALQGMPQDAIAHEFRSQVLFALQRYDEAAAELYAVLSVTPGWDWTTLIGLYGDPETYTQQLRALEDYRRDHPDSSSARFLLASQYIACGHEEAATHELQKVIQLNPRDGVSQQLLAMLTSDDQTVTPESPSPSVDAGPDIDDKQLTGTWTAQREGATYKLKFNDDGSFQWVYSLGETTQAVQGVFAVQGSSLVMELDQGGETVANLELPQPDSLKFLMVGGGESDPGLNFSRAAS